MLICTVILTNLEHNFSLSLEKQLLVQIPCVGYLKHYDQLDDDSLTANIACCTLYRKNMGKHFGKKSLDK